MSKSIFPFLFDTSIRMDFNENLQSNEVLTSVLTLLDL